MVPISNSTRRRLVPTLAALCATVLAGCSSGEVGVHYDEIHLAASHAGGAPVSGEAADYCFRLPALHGSRIEESVVVESPLVIRLAATTSSVSLEFVGAESGAPTLTLSGAELRDYSTSLSVKSASGSSFEIAVSTACP